MPDCIEYCVSNVPSDVRMDLPEAAEARPCLRACGVCYEGPFLAVDGRLVTGDSHASLLAECAGADE